MKLFSFILQILRKGSLDHKQVDFEFERRDLLKSIAVPAGDERKNGLKSFVLRRPMGYTLLANLAYLKDARKMNIMYFVSNSHRVVYVRILKAASTSVLKGFLPLVDKSLSGSYFNDAQIDALAFYYEKKALNDVQAFYSRFAVVRDPFRRIVSVYLDLFDPAAPTFTYASYWFGILKPGMTFKELIMTIQKIPRQLLGPHFASQHYILSNGKGLTQTIIFRIESDGEKLEQFLSQFDIKIHHLNKNVLTYDYRSYYDAQTLEIVRQIYDADVATFGYQQAYDDLKQYVMNG